MSARTPKKMPPNAYRSTLLAGCLAFASMALPTFAQSTAFTYQGELKSSGVPASGLHDFRFRLFDAASGGTAIGSQLCAEDVMVAAGRFTTAIDFGQSFVSTAPRFLEIEVRRDTGLNCANAGGFVVLSPRQPITPVPRATAASVANALSTPDGSPSNALVVDNDGKVGIGTTAPTQRLHVNGAAIIENMGNQADLLWLGSERPWVFRQEGTGAGTALKLQSVGGGGNKNFAIQTDGLVGIGTTAPGAKLDVRGDIRLGPTGALRAPGGEENLRIIRGNFHFRARPPIIDGTGFTVSNFDSGYRITFDTPFSGLPSFVLMAEESANGLIGELGWNFAPGDSITENSVTFHIFKRRDGGYTPASFSFIAIGPR